MSIIRDEYSEEVGDMWDAFAKALRTSSRDWIKLRKREPWEQIARLNAQSALAERADYGGLIGQQSAYNSLTSLAAYQNQMARNQQIMAVRQTYEPYPPNNRFFGGLFGSLL